jgi:hypothetical protein
MTTQTAPRSPAERFATIFAGLTGAVVTRIHFGLSQLLIGLIIDRIRGLKQRFARIAARVGAGTYAPRRFASRPQAEPKPRPPSQLPQKFGWLLTLVPPAVGARSQLQSLLRDPEMAALIAAAPTSLGRPLRSLCWMLGLRPPEIQALPAAPRKPRQKPPPAPEAPAPEPPPPPPFPEPPEWLRGLRRSLPQFARPPRTSRTPKNRA